MKQFVVKKASALGDKDPKYGQSYWCEVEEQIQPVMFNLMEGSVQEGDRITAEEILLKTSSKGTEYHRLKKVKVEEASPRMVTPQAVSDNDGLAKLEERVAKIEQHLFKELKNDTGDDSGKDEVVTDIGDEPFNLDDIPF